MQDANDKLDDRVAIITEQTVVVALKTRDVDYNKTSIEGALSSTLNELLVFVLDELSGIRDSFKVFNVQVTTAPESLAVVLSTIVRDTAATAPIARHSNKTVKQDVEESVIDPVFTPPSPYSPFIPQRVQDSLSDETCKSGKHKRAKKTLSRRKSSIFSVDKECGL